MEKFVAAVGALLLILGGVFLFIPLGTLFGGLVGYVVGIFFGDTILATLAQVGFKGLTMWQIGLTLGFVSGFFRASSTKYKE